jgi:hypothetical protein
MIERVRIFSPIAPTRALKELARPALPSGTGLRIGVLDNSKPHALALMRTAAQTLADADGGSVSVVLRKESPSVPLPDSFIQELLVSSDVVLTGTAD